MDKKKNYLLVKKFCQGLGVDLFGVADIKKIRHEFVLKPEVVNNLDYAISLGIRLSQAVLQEISDSPTRLYFHHYRQVNNALDQVSLRLVNYIQGKGFKALPIPASQILDWQKQTGHLSHKKIGELAGLGWLGRNNLLVNKKFGSQLRLVTILTNFPLKADNPGKDNCGDCFCCVKICPAGAIKNNPAEFDHLVCFEKLKDFQKQRLVDQYICGVCVNACRSKEK
ncbi:MAG: epoxyqueuosine reductase [Candidatus Omnitrophica bacterium]|nr:epoxyqueuosine reductase [Candidatus Omnitrophota bacterium]